MLSSLGPSLLLPQTASSFPAADPPLPVPGLVFLILLLLSELLAHYLTIFPSRPLSYPGRPTACLSSIEASRFTHRCFSGFYCASPAASLLPPHPPPPLISATSLDMSLHSHVLLRKSSGALGSSSDLHSRDTQTRPISRLALEHPFGRFATSSEDEYALNVPAFGFNSPSPVSSNGSGSLRQPSPTPMSYKSFLDTRSRVLRLRTAANASTMTVLVMFEKNRASVRAPISLWTTQEREEPNDMYAVFSSHDDATAAFALSNPSIILLPALESDLEPISSLRQVDLAAKFNSSLRNHTPHFGGLRMSTSTPDLHRLAQASSFSRVISPGFLNNVANDEFVISSNPPNPKTTFRHGDWICNSPSCAAHNFGRNMACRGCGCPRADNQTAYTKPGACGVSATARVPASPRFVGSMGSPQYPQSALPSPSAANFPASVTSNPRTSPASVIGVQNTKPHTPTHPLLTPSGRDFSVGGKVQNISSDPMCPCVMYWPDNEPLPEAGQIRPNAMAGFPHPPILNTGNRGPIEHQPGDWICLKCNYLNWRRRKVCQTCYPYAEGNGDSISAAVQAERIALLTSVLAQNQLPLTNHGMAAAHHQNARSHSVTPPQHHRTFADQQRPHLPAHRSRSHFDLGTQYIESQPIYETSGPRQADNSFPRLNDLQNALPNDAPLLPSFLHDIVQSPTLSPTSTSSADLSAEDYDFPSPKTSVHGRDRGVKIRQSTSNVSLGNIWRLNEEEKSVQPGIALPHHEDLVGNRKRSNELLRRPAVSP